MMIIVIDGTNSVMNRLGNLDKKTGSEFQDRCGKEISGVYEKNLKSALSQVVSYPTGKSMKAIRAKKVTIKGKPSWGVTILDRSFVLDAGREPGGAIPPHSAEIESWARRAWGGSGLSKKVWWLRYTIGEHGTKPRPFIRTGLVNSKQRVNRILKRYAKEVVKRGG